MMTETELGEVIPKAVIEAQQFYPGQQIGWLANMTRNFSTGRVKEDAGRTLLVEDSSGEVFHLPKGRAMAAACFSCAYFDPCRNHCYRLDLPFTKGGHRSECAKHKTELEPGDPYLPDIWEEEDQEFEQLFELPNSEHNEPNSEHSDSEPQTLLIEDILLTGGTQQRLKLDVAHVARLKSELEEGVTLDPVVVFWDGEQYWLADGFHRIQATQELAAESGDVAAIAAVVRLGNLRDAILYSVGANDHPVALPRSRADKRKAVLTLLSDPEWGQWSDRAIAEKCRVSHPTVSKIRREWEDSQQKKAPATRLARRNDTVYPISLNKKPFPDTEEENQQATKADPDISDPIIASAPPSPIKLNLDENLLGVLSNLSYYPLDKLEAAITLIQAEINDRRQKAA